MIRLLVLLALLAPASAWAVTYSDQGEAYAGCMSHAGRANANPSIGASSKPLVCKLSQEKTYCVARKDFGTCVATSTAYGYESSHTFTALCSARPEETGWKGGGQGGMGSVCHNGCEYSGSLWAGSPTGRLFEPTGQTCGSETPPPENVDPGDGGGDDGGGGGTEIPPGGGDGGDGGGDNGGGGGDGGSGGGGGGGGDGDGEGDGDGDGDGDGGGDGNGDGDGGGSSPGDGSGGPAGPTTGRLYKKSNRTVEKAVAEFKASMEGAPLLSDVKGFFGGCTGGGTCPAETWDGGQYAGKHSSATLCSGPLLALFSFAGYVFLAGISTVALRWALL